LLDLRCLGDLPLPPSPELEFPPLRMRSPVAADASMFDLVRERDLLVHHPFDSFEHTVVRFLRDAAADPAVTTIRITLYRVGDPSPVVESLLHAAHSGKRVVAFVELKARFDEEHNVSWARALERAGRQYTDLSLFSARENLTTDIADLFNALTGSSQPPHGLSNGALVAPNQLLGGVLARIARETAHARAGRPAAINVKVNGLSDPEVVRALYDASEAGVEIDLVVRGICTLAPGVPGRSSRIRITSVVGQFLEHSRIYRFANDGAPEYFIGSSDLRPRNLRRRVELLVPVSDPELRARLDRILELYQRDPTGWDLRSDGSYLQRSGAGRSAQAELAAYVESPGRLFPPRAT
jgi:polyphosphate kinase